MIAVDRSRIPCPAVLDLTNPTSKSAVETAQAIAYVLKTSPKPPKYAVYKHDSVRLALINLFHGKCAYCETPINAAAAREIEHFRPKGRINPGDGKKLISPGYYWLAAMWDNLVLACPGCNRSQRQLQRNASGYFTYEKVATGKHDLFPIRGDEHNRVRQHTEDTSNEESYRLLLHPCHDRPEEHLHFDDKGFVWPRQIHGVLSDQGIWSIEVYALKRPVLREARHARYLDLLGYWENIKEITRLMHEAESDYEVERIARIVRLNEANIKSRLKDDQPYAGMLRQLTTPWLAELRSIKAAYEVMFGKQI